MQIIKRSRHERLRHSYQKSQEDKSGLVRDRRVVEDHVLYLQVVQHVPNNDDDPYVVPNIVNDSIYKQLKGRRIVGLVEVPFAASIKTIDGLMKQLEEVKNGLLRP